MSSSEHESGALHYMEQASGRSDEPSGVVYAQLAVAEAILSLVSAVRDAARGLPQG